MSKPRRNIVRRRGSRLSRTLAWLLCFFPLIGQARAQVLYHCQLTGELLTACCCEVQSVAEAPCASSSQPEARASSCCEGPEANDESRAQTPPACECCAVLFGGDLGVVQALPESLGGDLHQLLAWSALVLALDSQLVQPSSHAAAISPREPPPGRPLFRLFSVDRS